MTTIFSQTLLVDSLITHTHTHTQTHAHRGTAAFPLYFSPLLSIIWCILIFNEHTHTDLRIAYEVFLAGTQLHFQLFIQFHTFSIMSLLPRMLYSLSYPLPGWLLFFKTLPTVASSGNLSDLDSHTPSSPSLGWVSLYWHLSLYRAPIHSPTLLFVMFVV